MNAIHRYPEKAFPNYRYTEAKQSSALVSSAFYNIFKSLAFETTKQLHFYGNATLDLQGTCTVQKLTIIDIATAGNLTVTSAGLHTHAIAKSLSATQTITCEKLLSRVISRSLTNLLDISGIATYSYTPGQQAIVIDAYGTIDVDAFVSTSKSINLHNLASLVATSTYTKNTTRSKLPVATLDIFGTYTRTRTIIRQLASDIDIHGTLQHSLTRQEVLSAIETITGTVDIAIARQGNLSGTLNLSIDETIITEKVPSLTGTIAFTATLNKSIGRVRSYEAESLITGLVAIRTGQYIAPPRQRLFQVLTENRNFAIAQEIRNVILPRKSQNIVIKPENRSTVVTQETRIFIATGGLMALKWQVKKDPDAVKDYGVDWSAIIATGETIVDVDWTVPDGLEGTDPVLYGNVATIWLGGGTAGMQYQVKCKITTSRGLIDERTITLSVAEQ